MAVYWVSFRLNKAEYGETYGDRRQSIIDVVNEISTKIWEDTTSFLVFETSIKSTQDVTERLTRGLYESHDRVLVRRVDYTSCFVWGLIEDDDIFKLMPTLKILEG